MQHPVLDRIIARSTGPAFAEEVQRARGVYFTRTGRLDEEAGDLDARMAAFLEWYLFEWRLPGGHTAVERFALEEAETLPEPERRIARRLCASHHSLFLVTGMADSAVYLEDLVGGGAWQVDERRKLAALERGDLMETRLLPFERSVVFSSACSFHPRGAREAIAEVVAQARAERRPHDELMLELERMRLDAERYRHVALDRVYRLSAPRAAAAGTGAAARPVTSTLAAPATAAPGELGPRAAG